VILEVHDDVYEGGRPASPGSDSAVRWKAATRSSTLRGLPPASRYVELVDERGVRLSVS